MLTPRQLEILPLLAYSNRQIAQRLGIACGTVKNHLSVIYREVLGDERGEGTTRVRALTTALREDMIQLENVDYGRPIMERGEQA